MSKLSWPEKIKRWILPGKGKSRIVAVTGAKADRDVKFIYKKYKAKPSQHLTLMITNDGLIDAHLTDEATGNHTPLFKGHVDIKYLKEQAEKLYQKSLKPIDVNNPIFLSYYVLVPKSPEAYMEFYVRSYVRDDRIVMPATKREERQVVDSMEEYFDIFTFDEVSPHHIPFGLCANEEGDMGILFGEKENYYFFSITDAMNIFLSSIKQDF